MKRLYVLMAVGVALGAIVAGPLGATVGLLLGAAVGGIFMLLESLATPSLASAPVSRLARRRFICIPGGSPAEALLERDPGSGRWTNVHHCSLCSPTDRVLCEKSCLRLLNDAKVA